MPQKTPAPRIGGGAVQAERQLFVDNSTSPVTFWVGNNHGASIVKLEPLDD